MIVILTYTGILHVAWSRMGGQWGYQQFFSAAPTNRHSVCGCTWLEEVHHPWRGKVAICAWECEPQVARCTWSPPPGMCLYLLSEPPTVQSWASPSQRVAHYCLLQTVQNPALGFLRAADGFLCAGHRAAVSQLVARPVCLALCVCLCHGLSPAVCLIPTCSASPRAGRFFSSAHHHQPDAHPAPVRFFSKKTVKERWLLVQDKFAQLHFGTGLTISEVILYYIKSADKIEKWTLLCHGCSTSICHL